MPDRLSEMRKGVKYIVCISNMSMYCDDTQVTTCW